MKTLGIIGGGQLGRMLVEAAQKLKISTIVLDPTVNSPAGQLTDQVVGDFKDPNEIKKFAKLAKYLTFEIESANSKILRELQETGSRVNPSPQSLEVIQDKFLQKHFLMSQDLPVPDFTRVESEKDIKKAAAYLGYPLVLKSRFHAYDGRGNAIIGSEKDIKSALKKLAGSELYIEEFISFRKELAVQIVRGKNGKLVTYPVVETIQKNSICHIVKYPAMITKATEKSALDIANKTVSKLFGTGVFAVELFLTGDGKILINEIAPRVHNSGHWTIEGCNHSQFESHVKSVCELAIEDVKPKCKAAVMVNILGKRNGKAKPVGLGVVKKMDGTYVHIYGKFETRVARKMGHVTVIGNDLKSVYKKALLAQAQINI